MKTFMPNRYVAFAIALIVSLPAMADDDKPELTPGKETRIDIKGIGQDHFMLYLPKNYDDTKDWPVIVYFHGMNGKPGTHLPKTITQGKHFIIAGMGYPNSGPASGSGAGTKAQVENIKTVLKYVHKHTSIDEKSIMLMGWSKGGWAGSAYVEASGELWRGLVLMGSGRTGNSPNALRGKSVFIGVGENDGNKSSAESAADVYRKAGAQVAVEIWEDLGHRVNSKSQTMRSWIVETGLLYEVPALIKAAKRHEKARKLGMAYTAYLAASEKLPEHKTCQQAKAKADELAANAKAMIDNTRTAINDQDWSAATRAISNLSRQFSGSAFGDQAKTLRKELAEKRRQSK